MKKYNPMPPEIEKLTCSWRRQLMNLDFLPFVIWKKRWNSCMENGKEDNYGTEKD